MHKRFTGHSADRPPKRNLLKGMEEALDQNEEKKKEETKDLRLFAVKTDKACQCCGDKFGFMTHGHAVIVADAENKDKLPYPKEEDIVAITMSDVHNKGLTPIDVREYQRQKGLEDPEPEDEKADGSEPETEE